MSIGFKLQSNFVKELRRKSGLTQAELAKKVGFGNAQFISNMERGLAAIPPERAKLFAKALKTDVSRIASAAANDFETRYLAEVERRK